MGTVSSTLAVPEPPHIVRLKSIVHVLAKLMENSGEANGMYGRLGFFMTTFTDDLAEDLAELPEAKVRVFMYQIGEVISWIGHGDNTRLPPELIEFAEMVQPSSHVDGNASTHLGSDTATR